MWHGLYTERSPSYRESVNRHTILWVEMVTIAAEAAAVEPDWRYHPTLASAKKFNKAQICSEE